MRKRMSARRRVGRVRTGVRQERRGRTLLEELAFELLVL